MPNREQRNCEKAKGMVSPLRFRIWAKSEPLFQRLTHYLFEGSNGAGLKP